MKQILRAFWEGVKDLFTLDEEERCKMDDKEKSIWVKSFIIAFVVGGLIILMYYILKSIPKTIYGLIGLIALWVIYRYAIKLNETPVMIQKAIEEVGDLTGSIGWHKGFKYVICPVYTKLLHRVPLVEEVMYFGPKRYVAYYYARLDDHKLEDETICRMLERLLANAAGITLKEVVQNHYIRVCSDCVIIFYDLERLQ